MFKLILASKSKVRKEILDTNNIPSQVEPSNVDEDIIKKSLLKEKTSPETISKNLAELKANKISQKKIIFGGSPDPLPPPVESGGVTLHMFCKWSQAKF